MTALAIETAALTKRFGRREAVAGIDLAVPAGSVYGFLGPNGSGKTTTIRMLLGLIRPTAGQVRVLGAELPDALPRVLPRVGALVEGPGFAGYLTGAQNLARLDSAEPGTSRRLRAARIDDALDRVGLTAAAGRKVKAYSLGMKQRLGLAGALLRPRELLVLDEPSNGLDPQGTREVRSLVRSLADDGATVFVSSHLLAEIEQICTHAAVMRTGRLVAQGTIGELRGAGAGAAAATATVRTPDAALAAQVLASLTGSPATPGTGGAGGGADRVDTRLGAVAPEAAVAALVAAGVRVRGFAVAEPSLEDRFVALTGEGFDVES